MSSSTLKKSIHFEIHKLLSSTICLFCKSNLWTHFTVYSWATLECIGLGVTSPAKSQTIKIEMKAWNFLLMKNCSISNHEAELWASFSLACTPHDMIFAKFINYAQLKIMCGIFLKNTHCHYYQFSTYAIELSSGIFVLYIQPLC